MAPTHLTTLLNFPPALFYRLFAAAMFLSVPLCFSSLQTTGPIDCLVSISYWIDSLVLNFISYVLMCAVVVRKLRSNQSEWSAARAFRVTVGVLILTAALLAISYGLEVRILKPSFAHHRPPLSAGETILVSRIFGDHKAPESSTPSGFILRQSLMLLTCVIASYRSKKGDGDVDWTFDRLSAVLTSVVLLITIIVGVVRVGRGLHTPLDIGIGLACGYFCFLLGFYSLFWFAHRRQEVSRAVLSALLVFGPVFFFYSGSGAYWVTLILLTFVLISIPEFLPDKKKHT